MEQITPDNHSFDDIISFFGIDNKTFDDTSNAPVYEDLIAQVMAGKADISDINIMRHALQHSEKWRHSLFNYLKDEKEYVDLLNDKQKLKTDIYIAEMRAAVLTAIKNNGPDYFWDLINLECEPAEDGPLFDTLKLLQAYGERPCSLDIKTVMVIAINVSKYKNWRRNFDVLQDAEKQALQDQKISVEDTAEFLHGVRQDWIEEVKKRLKESEK
jgi:hypothetical protein